MREDAAGKARRLLAEGRVYVVRIDGAHVDAVVRGASAELYHVRHDGDEWSCTCPAVGPRCSHVPSGS